MQKLAIKQKTKSNNSAFGEWGESDKKRVYYLRLIEFVMIESALWISAKLFEQKKNRAFSC